MQNLRRATSWTTMLGLLAVALIATAPLAVAQSQTSSEASPALAGQTITAQYLYASDLSADLTKGLIAGYRLGSNGKLTSTGAPIVISSRATLVPSKLGAKLFGIGARRIWSFGVDPITGRLKFLSVIRFPSNVFGIALGINPQSTLLFAGKVIDPGTPNEVRRITTYRISPSGALTPISSKVVHLVDIGFDGEARNIVVDPTGKFMYVNTTGPNFTFNITQLQVNGTTGALTFVHDFSLGQPNNVSTIVRSPGGRFLYQGFDTPNVKVCSIDSISGSLHEIQDVNCSCDGSPDFGGAMALDAQGRFLFQATGQDDGIAVYSRNTTGLLTPLPNSFFSQPGGGFPLFTVDATGKFLELVEGTVVSTFAVGSNGTPTRVDGSSAPLPANIFLRPQLRVLAVRQ